MTLEMISSIKTGLMGPLAGIGDTIWQGTLSPIALGIILGMAKVGNFMGPLIYLLTIGIVLFGLGYVSYTKVTTWDVKESERSSEVDY